MSRRLRGLGAIFLASWALALALEQPWRGDAIDRTTASVERLFPRLQRERDGVARVELRAAGGRAVTLVREGAAFVIEQKLGHPADRARLGLLLDALAALDTRDVVSVNPEKRAVYGVDEAQGVAVTVFDANGGLLADLIAGKLRSQDLRQGGGLRLEFYVRPAGRDEVLQVEELPLPATAPEEWLARRLFPVDSAELLELQRLDLEGQQAESWKLERIPAADDPATEEVEDHAWRMTEPRVADAPLFAGDSWAFSLCGVGPADVVARLEPGEQPREPAWGFTTNAFHAVAAGGRELVLYLGRPAAADARYAWIPGLPWVYTIPEHDAIQLRMPVERMLRED